jgi:hypothetical protein
MTSKEFTDEDSLESLRAVTRAAIAASGWPDHERNEALGVGPCPGDPDDPEGRKDRDEDEEPSYPSPEWDGKHDFDGGQCWRCGGAAPGWTVRRPSVTVDAVHLLELLNVLVVRP